MKNAVFDINQFSQENLDRQYKIITVILDYLEIQPIDRLKSEYRVPIDLFERKGLIYDEDYYG